MVPRVQRTRDSQHTGDVVGIPTTANGDSTALRNVQSLPAPRKMQPKPVVCPQVAQALLFTLSLEGPVSASASATQGTDRVNRSVRTHGRPLGHYKMSEDFGYFEEPATTRLFFTEKTLGTPFARNPAKFLSVSLSATPSK